MAKHHVSDCEFKKLQEAAKTMVSKQRDNNLEYTKTHPDSQSSIGEYDYFVLEVNLIQQVLGRRKI